MPLQSKETLKKLTDSVLGKIKKLGILRKDLLDNYTGTAAVT